MTTPDWDPARAQANLKRHGVSFDEARTVFWDDNVPLIADPEHSDDEDRFIILGVSERLKVLVVCHCHRASDEVIRRISARRAGPDERREDEGFLP
jgi:hypothetical protein